TVGPARGNRIVQRLLLDEREQWHKRTQPVKVSGDARRVARTGRASASWREPLKDVRIIVKRQSKLLEPIGALGPPCRFTGGLNRGQQQGDEDTDNCNHNQQFNESERRARRSLPGS